MLNYILALIFCKITKWPQKSFLLQINPKSSFKHSNHANLSFWFNFGKLPNWSSKFVKFTSWPLYLVKLQFYPIFAIFIQTILHSCYNAQIMNEISINIQSKGLICKTYILVLQTFDNYQTALKFSIHFKHIICPISSS